MTIFDQWYFGANLVLSLFICFRIWIIKYHTSHIHYSDIIMSTMSSQITGVSIVYSIVCSGAEQTKHQNSASLTFVRGIHRWPVNSLHKWPVTRKMLPFDYVIMSKYDVDPRHTDSRCLTNVMNEVFHQIMARHQKDLCMKYEAVAKCNWNTVSYYIEIKMHKENLRDLIAATGLVILLTLNSNRNISAHMTFKFNG